MPTAICLRQRAVDAHFEGTISPSDELAMRAHLETCDGCRSRYRKRLLLAKLDPEALSAEERIGRGLGIRTRTTKNARWLRVASGASVLVAAAMLFLFARPKGPEFTARGRARGAAETVVGQASPVHVYRVPPSGTPRPLESPVGRNEELAFAYENRDQKPYLMIFGVSETGDVYWFFPSWTDPAKDPTALAIDRGSVAGQSTTLPDAIRHRFVGSRLEIHGLFLDAPLGTRAVEAAVAAHTVRSLGVDHVSEYEVAR